VQLLLRAHGLENIGSALPPLILGDDLSLAYYLVGGDVDCPPSSTHLYLEIVRATTEEIHVLVRLFADLGAPVYRVIVSSRRLQRPA
jgi:hypothetical protein